LRGERITSTEMVKAKCYECMGGYGDDKADCMITRCPLHPIMPYNENKTKVRIMSEENKKAVGERMRKIQAEKKAQNDI